MEKRALNPPSVSLAPKGVGHSGLIPPSHFETRRQTLPPLPPVPPLASPTNCEPWEELSKELSKLKQENEELRKRPDREDGARARSLERQLPDVAPTESRALEIIAHQMREMQKLERAVADAQDKEEELRRLAQEVPALKLVVTKAGQAEERRKQEEERRRQAEETAEQQRLEELRLLSESHKMELDSARSKVHILEMKLQEVHERKAQEVTGLTEELQAANHKSETAEAQLSHCHLELERQNSLVQQLRTYIGELVPDNRHAEEQKMEMTELKNTIQILEKERDALQTSMSLLQTRLLSLTHILSLQESDLCKKTGTHTDGQKTQMLLKRWREKVFSLMVQLKSEEINKESDDRKIREQICSLENALQESNQQLALYSHTMQDRTAELEIERVQNKCLQDKLGSAVATSSRLSSRIEKAEQTALQLKQMIDRFVQALPTQETSLRGALQRMVTLGQRVSFAAKRVDTIQGLVAQRLALVKLAQEERPSNTVTEADICRPSYEDLESEIKLLNGERERLSAELKRGVLIIEGKVTETRERLEAEIEDCRQTTSLLRHSLHEAEEREGALREQVAELERRLQEACETSAQLKEQLNGQKGEYERELQHKVSEVEEKTTQRLAQMEKQLHEARREHTKAVVALRQTERQMQREKTRSQETMHTLEDGARLREEQLSLQLREADRDKNLMIATLRQEGLLTTYQKNRTAAVQLADTSTEKGHRPGEAFGSGCTPGLKESISSMLANLQSLGATLLSDEDAGDLK
ncbi:coiled-coil alpha-helical rod protein 1 isoform X2 [Pseudophryne corroboree]|uniref:coiled-coil alpha-helical rod protein 1 isoform X2 n=1 Tax=Pseudophryne corroboree TaxID=495146 RepID=UPI003081BB22